MSNSVSKSRNTLVLVGWKAYLNVSKDDVIARFAVESESDLVSLPAAIRAAHLREMISSVREFEFDEVFGADNVYPLLPEEARK